MAPSPSAPDIDAEITALRAKLTSLKRTLALQTSNLLSSPSATATLLAAPALRKHHHTSSSHPATLSPAQTATLETQISNQQTHNTQTLYRALCATTTFLVRDPDPCAVDGGRILGLRFEAPSATAEGRYVKSYYVLLNRPYQGDGEGDGDEGEGATISQEQRKSYFHIHKHTLPPCIPLSPLSARHLPPPPKTGGRRGKKQDLPKFTRRLRREILRYHNRVSIIADMRRACGLLPPTTTQQAQDQTQDGQDKLDETTIPSSPDPDATLLHPDPIASNSLPSSFRPTSTPGNTIISITPADPPAKQISISWADGRAGRIVLDDDGFVTKAVVVHEGGGGRDRRGLGAKMAALGSDAAVGKRMRVEEVVGWLRDGRV